LIGKRADRVTGSSVPPPVTVTCLGPEYTLRSEGDDNKAPNLAEHECEIVFAGEVGEGICKLTAGMRLTIQHLCFLELLGHEYERTAILRNFDNYTAYHPRRHQTSATPPGQLRIMKCVATSKLIMRQED
jgi:hypothetical protein